MKTIKTLFIGFMAVFAMHMASPSVKAEKFTPEQLQAVVVELQKQLPEDLGDGMVWTKAALTPENNLLFVLEINPEGIGVTLKDFKEEVSKWTAEDWRRIVGDEMKELKEMLGCDVFFTLQYPDNTSQTARL